MCVSTLLQDLAVSHRRDELLLCFADPHFLLLRSLASTPYVWQLRPPSRPAILTTFPPAILQEGSSVNSSIISDVKKTSPHIP